MPDALSSLYGGRGISLVSGRGSRVTDSEGREYLDFFNGHGAALFGHADETLVGALVGAAGKIWSPGAGFDSPARMELADILSGFLEGGRVFISNSGAEAIEAALKLAVALRPKRSRILACRRAFHGRTCGALSLTFNPKYKTMFKILLPNVEHYNPGELAERIDDDTAAVFIEPAQGEGGVYPLDPEVGREISGACEKRGALLVADEIQTGLGRCGAMLASELVGLRPDVVCLAKGLAGGLPIGATIWKGALGDFPSHTHGSTYGGNDISASVGVAALKLIKEKNYTAHAVKIGGELRSALSALKEEAPVIKEVRGIGLLNGVEVEVPSLDLVKSLQKGGLLCLAAGPRVVRFLPSFAASSEDVSEAVSIFGNLLNFH
ncbi:aspartate aminotransferase family protein [Synergistales bacterium]|nr:aspartate aminotransferase family protein [Synergistales bacterium]